MLAGLNTGVKKVAVVVEAKEGLRLKRKNESLIPPKRRLVKRMMFDQMVRFIARLFRFIARLFCSRRGASSSEVPLFDEGRSRSTAASAPNASNAEQKNKSNKRIFPDPS